MNIYEVGNEYKKLQSLIENGDFTEEELEDTLESINFDIEDKAEAYGLVMKNLEAQADGLKAEANRLSERSNAITANIKRMSDNLLSLMMETGKLKFKTDHFSFSTRKSSSVIILDDKAIPKGYTKTKIVITFDKLAIKTALKSGVEIAGAEIKESTNISIK